MRWNVVLFAAMVFGSILCASAPEAMAGAQDTGALASCEIARSQSKPIDGTAAVTIDLSTSLAATAFRTRAHTEESPLVVIRALVGVDTGTSPMEVVCQILNGPTAEGGPTLADQILAAAGLTGRTIKITKRSILGCDVPPCEDPGRRGIDLALVPGSAETGSPILSALGDIRLFAVKP